MVSRKKRLWQEDVRSDTATKKPFKAKKFNSDCVFRLIFGDDFVNVKSCSGGHLMLFIFSTRFHCLLLEISKYSINKSLCGVQLEES